MLLVGFFSSVGCCCVGKGGAKLCPAGKLGSRAPLWAVFELEELQCRHRLWDGNGVVLTAVGVRVLV